MTGSRRINLFISLSLLVVAALAIAACGGGGSATATSAAATTSGGRSATVTVGNSALGKILVDAQGRTLYLFKADSGSVSACGGACAVAWPPLLVRGNPIVGGGADRSLVATIQRPSGARQLTYDGHPLYRFVDDQKPGEVNGEAVTAFGAPWYALSAAGDQFATPLTARAEPVKPGETLRVRN
jgi:predicted lipoprotein with Yx(FWY)xxD motif